MMYNLLSQHVQKKKKNTKKQQLQFNLILSENNKLNSEL